MNIEEANIRLKIKFPNLTIIREVDGAKRRFEYKCEKHGVFEAIHPNVIVFGCQKCNVDRRTRDLIYWIKKRGWEDRFSITPIEQYTESNRLLDLKLKCVKCGVETVIKGRSVAPYYRNNSIPLCKNCISQKKEAIRVKREEKTTKYSFKKPKKENTDLKKEVKAVTEDKSVKIIPATQYYPVDNRIKKESKTIPSPRRGIKSYIPSVDCAGIKKEGTDILEYLPKNSGKEMDYLEVVIKNIDDELHSFYEYMISQKLPNEVFCEMNNRLNKMRLSVSRIRKYYGLKSY